MFFCCCFFICGFFNFKKKKKKITFSKKALRNTINVSNSLDPDQARDFVWPDLGPNCLERQKLPLMGKELDQTKHKLYSSFCMIDSFQSDHLSNMTLMETQGCKTIVSTCCTMSAVLSCDIEWIVLETRSKTRIHSMRK